MLSKESQINLGKLLDKTIRSVDLSEGNIVTIYFTDDSRCEFKAIGERVYHGYIHPSTICLLLNVDFVEA